jgi:predicted acyl esterase
MVVGHGARSGGMAVVVATLVGLAVWGTAAPSQALGVREFSCYVRMRDGVCLPTTIYLPRMPRGPYPVILVRTTYGRDEVSKKHARYVNHKGFALVVQDMRNCTTAPGKPMLFANDAYDGHDTILWIAGQSWCSGAIGTWGPSALGFAQLMLAPDAPPFLRAQHVMMSFSNMYAQAAYQGGAFRKELVEPWLGQRPCGQELLQAVREHPTYDEFWAQLNPEAKVEQVNVPAVYWGGWHDPFVEGTINSFTLVNSRGGPLARGHSRLILGPWTHESIGSLIDPRNPPSYPAAAEPVRWFDYWLKCVTGSVPCDWPVQYYVNGDPCDPSSPGNRWRFAQQWPPAGTAKTLFLGPQGTLHGDAPAGEEKRTYRYDPADPVPTLGGRNLNIQAGPMDQQSLESRADVLVFTGDALTEPLEVAGPVTARLFVASDAPDTDFTVKLTDVSPDGRSVLVTDGVRRARFRNSYSKPEPMEPGKVYELSVDAGSVAYAFSAGHRIRIAISSSNAPRFEPNPNTGLPAGQGQPRVAANTLHLSKEHPSQVLLPVVAAGQ